MKEQSEKKNWRPVKFGEALAILLIMLLVMGTGVIKFGLSPTTPVLLVIALVILWSKIRGADWDTIHDGIIDGIKTGIIPIFIFLLIGALISVWIAAGIIPSMMVFGFHLISAQWFVPSVFLVCAIIGTSIGSAFTIISTIGIALFSLSSLSICLFLPICFLFARVLVCLFVTMAQDTLNCATSPIPTTMILLALRLLLLPMLNLVK